MSAKVVKLTVMMINWDGVIGIRQCDVWTDQPNGLLS